MSTKAFRLEPFQLPDWQIKGKKPSHILKRLCIKIASFIKRLFFSLPFFRSRIKGLSQLDNRRMKYETDRLINFLRLNQKKPNSIKFVKKASIIIKKEDIIFHKKHLVLKNQPNHADPTLKKLITFSKNFGYALTDKTFHQKIITPAINSANLTLKDIPNSLKQIGTTYTQKKQELKQVKLKDDDLPFHMTLQKVESTIKNSLDKAKAISNLAFITIQILLEMNSDSQDEAYNSLLESLKTYSSEKKIDSNVYEDIKKRLELIKKRKFSKKWLKKSLEKKIGTYKHFSSEQINLLTKNIDKFLEIIFDSNKWLILRDTQEILDVIMDTLAIADTAAKMLHDGKLDHFLNKFSFTIENELDPIFYQTIRKNLGKLIEHFIGHLSSVIEKMHFKKNYDSWIYILNDHTSAVIVAEKERKYHIKQIPLAINNLEKKPKNLKESNIQNEFLDYLINVNKIGKEKFPKIKFLFTFSKHKYCHKKIKKLIKLSLIDKLKAKQFKKKLFDDLADEFCLILFPKQKIILDDDTKDKADWTAVIWNSLFQTEKLKTSLSHIENFVNEVLTHCKLRNRLNVKTTYRELIKQIIFSNINIEKRVKDTISTGLESLFKLLTKPANLRELFAEQIYPMISELLIQALVSSSISHNLNNNSSFYTQLLKNNLTENERSQLLDKIWKVTLSHKKSFNLKNAKIDREQFDKNIWPLLESLKLEAIENIIKAVIKRHPKSINPIIEANINSTNDVIFRIFQKLVTNHLSTPAKKLYNIKKPDIDRNCLKDVLKKVIKKIQKRRQKGHDFKDSLNHYLTKKTKNFSAYGKLSMKLVFNIGHLNALIGETWAKRFRIDTVISELLSDVLGSARSSYHFLVDKIITGFENKLKLEKGKGLDSQKVFEFVFVKQEETETKEKKRERINKELKSHHQTISRLLYDLIYRNVPGYVPGWALPKAQNLATMTNNVLKTLLSQNKYVNMNLLYQIFKSTFANLTDTLTSHISLQDRVTYVDVK